MMNTRTITPPITTPIIHNFLSAEPSSGGGSNSTKVQISSKGHLVLKYHRGMNQNIFGAKEKSCNY